MLNFELLEDFTTEGDAKEMKKDELRKDFRAETLEDLMFVQSDVWNTLDYLKVESQAIDELIKKQKQELLLTFHGEEKE